MKHRGLQIDENLRFQQREWRTSRAAWIVLLLTMAAMALGLFGNGPLSEARAGEPGDALWVEYSRFGRFGATMRLTVHARAEPDGAMRMTIGRPLLEAFQVIQITPNPSAGRLTEHGVEYRIDAAPTGDISIRFDLQPARRWLVQGTIESAGRTVQLTHFIYP